MAYPPELPPSTRTDSTISANNHAADHNKLVVAIRSIIEVLGASPQGSSADIAARTTALELAIANIGDGGADNADAIDGIVETLGEDPAGTYADLTARLADLINNAQLTAKVNERLVAAVADVNTVAAAAAAAVTTAIAGRNLLEKRQFQPTSDVIFTMTGDDLRRWWLEVAADGGPTAYSVQKMAAVLPFLPGQGFDAGLNGLMWAVLDSTLRRTDMELGLDGHVTDRVIALWRDRLSLTSGRSGEPAYSPRVAPFDTAKATYGLNQRGMASWLNKLAGAAAGKGTAHLALYGTSRVYGAGDTGSDYPKWSNAFPGLIRKALDQLIGFSGGTGWVMPWDEVFARPNGDPRITWGSAVTSATTYGVTPNLGYGPHGLSGAIIATGANGWLQFAPTVTNVDRFRFALAIPAGGAGLATVKVDGASVGTISLAADGSGGASLTRESGHPANMAVYAITGLTPGTHTLRIDGVTSGTAIVTMLDAGTGKGVRVSSFARSSSGYNEWLRDDPAGRYGMHYSIDLPKPDLAVVGDFTNDRGYTVAVNEAKFRTEIERLLAAGSDILLMPLSKPDFTSLGDADPAGKAVLWDQYIGKQYQLRDEYGLAGVVDESWAVGTYAEAEQEDLFADYIHEYQIGHERIKRLLLPAIAP